MTMPIRVSIEGMGFRKLVRGEELIINGVHIIFEDFGFGIMRHHIDEAERDQNEARTRTDTDLRGGDTES